MKIWQRYLLRRLATSFLFFLLCLFTIYVLLDLSIHGVRFLRGNNTHILDLLLYYLRHFAIHLDLFVPLTFILSTLKTLLDLSLHLELVALQAAGLSKKQLLAPFFLFAALLSFMGHANHEWIVPSAGIAAETFKDSRSKSKRKRARQEEMQTIVLQDGSELVYQRYNQKTKEFFDVFWICSAGDIWTMKTLSTSPPVGKFIDHLVRNQEGLLEQTESFEMRPFPNLLLQKETLLQTVPNEYRSISSLIKEPLPCIVQQAGAKTYLHRKLSLPLLSLLVPFAIAPFALTFSRTRKTLLLVCFSLFGFIVTMTLFESLTILGENWVLSPEISMWSPLLVILGFNFKRFWLM